MLPNINLLPKYERQSPIYFIIIVGLFIIWLLTLAFLIYQYVAMNGKLENSQVQSEELNLEIVRLEKKLDEVAADDDGTLEDAVNYAERLVLPTSVLIYELIKSLPDNGYLSKYRYEQGEITIETQFEEFNNAADYTEKLVTSNYIKDAKVNEVTTFQQMIHNEQIEINAYQVVPRYHVIYSLEVNRKSLREELKQNE